MTMARRVFHVELPIRQEWEAIEPLRASVLACLRTVFRDLATCEALAMVACELLENALKYGDWARAPAAPFTLRVTGTDREVEVVVANPVDPASAGVRQLLAELRRIEAAPSARDAFTERLRAVATTTGAMGGLGLARIAYEAGCALSAELADGVLRVRAITRPTSDAARASPPASPPP